MSFYVQTVLAKITIVQELLHLRVLCSHCSYFLKPVKSIQQHTIISGTWFF